jgi:hypothetical protein
MSKKSVTQKPSAEAVGSRAIRRGGLPPTRRLSLKSVRLGSLQFTLFTDVRFEAKLPDRASAVEGKTLPISGREILRMT